MELYLSFYQWDRHNEMLFRLLISIIILKIYIVKPSPGFFSNLEVLLLLQKCHAKGQKLKLDKMKV